MTQQTINIGSLPNDGTGDTLRSAFDKVNNNFAELYNAAILTTSVTSAGNANSALANSAIVFQTNAAAFTQGIFQINSQQVGANNSQNVTLNVARNSNSNSISHTAYSSMFFGNIAVVTGYDVTIANIANTANANVIESNVQITVTQNSANLPNVTSILHTVAYRIS